MELKRVDQMFLFQYILILGYIYGNSTDVTGPSTSPTEVTWTTVNPGTLCGDGLCHCERTRADCSGHFGNITYVPKLPENIRSVDLSRNNFTSKNLTDDFFANVTHINALDLSHNNLSWLPRTVFRNMDNLSQLCLDGNKALKPASLREVMSIQSLRSVLVQHCNLPPPTKDLFKNITSMTRSLYFDSNPHGGSYNLQGFCPLRSLKNLYLLDCDFKKITSSCPLPELSMLDLSGNTLRTFPKTCVEQGVSMFPALMSLSLDHNRIEVLSMSDICLPSLTRLTMSYNFIKSFPTGAFSSLKFPALTQLRLHHQSSYWDMFVVGTKIEDRAFDNPNLYELDLRHSELEFADTGSISKHAFTNCHNLRELLLDSNNFTHVYHRQFLDFFGQMKLLKLLSIAGSKLETLPIQTLTRFPNLEYLFLQDNIISDIPDGAFDSLKRLHILYLHNNKIKSISEHTFSKGLRQHLSTLTLGLNPFMCSCDLLWFQRWFTEVNPKLFNSSKSKQSDYTCNNIPGMPLINFSMSHQACVLSREVNLLLIQCSSIFIFAMTLVSFTFRYRWHIRLLMYEMFRGRADVRRQRLQANNFDYDVFVSYASEDLPWVRQHLMPRLEDDLGLRLCIHERDFILGHHIVDNIVHSVDASKKILMVFSADFIRSQWCQFELALCLSHVMEHDDALIVVCVDDVTSRQMTSAMMAVLKTTTYIQWREEQDAVVSFWGRLHLALNELFPQNENYV